MAKVLFVNIPAHGHVNPTFPLVAAFVKAGHTVDYLISEDFRKKVEYSGATLIPYYKQINIHSKFQGLKYVRKLLNEMNIKIKEIAEKYDVIVAGGLNPAIAKLEKDIKTPIVFCSAVFLQNEKTILHLFKKSNGIPEPINFIARHPGVRRCFSRLIVSPLLGVRVDDILTMFSPQSSTLNIAFTSRYFQPEEATFNDKCLFIGPTPTVSIDDDKFPINKLETSKKKIIYATLGTIFNTWTDFFKNVIEAFKNSDYLVVMSTGNEGRLKQIGDIPENFIVRDFVPQAEVLKYTDLFIAHGGMGSVSDGMYLGVPMLLVPLGADQFFNAYRLQELGAAKVLKKKELTSENLKREAKLIFENKSVKAAVKRVQESFITSGGPSWAVKEVEKLL